MAKLKLVLGCTLIVILLEGIIPNHHIMFIVAKAETFNVLETQNGQKCGKIEVSLKMYTNCDTAGGNHS